MATNPTQRTWTSGETVTAAMLNSNIRDAINFLKNPPTGYAYQNAATTVATGAGWTNIPLDTEFNDSDNMFTTGTPGRLTIVTPGLYYVEGQVRYSSSTSGTFRAARIQVNGATDLDTQYVPLAPSSATEVYLKGWRQLAAGDYLTISGNHDHTAALNVNVGNYHYTYLRALWISI